MAMIGVNQLKVGVSFVDDDGAPYKILKYDFAKIGRGKANIKVKARNLETGAIVVKSYLSGNKVERMDVSKKELQFLYKDQDNLYFMDPNTFEQQEIDKEIVGRDIHYLVEGEMNWVVSWQKGDGGEIILGVELPASIVMEVVETGSAEKGNSATNVLKPAKLSSGLTISVPMFVKTGDKVKINTSSGEYVGRLN